MHESFGPEGHPALTDEQTGLPNRLHFQTVFEVVFAAGLRGVPLSLLLVEIEGYHPWVVKEDAPDTDRILRALGSTLRPLVRKTDILARLDEARFVVCLMDCNMAGAVLVADRIDGLLDNIRGRTGLGFSIGGAAFAVDMRRPEDLLGAAEAALRSAQTKGTDQMEFQR
jgi:diguanylate cyclase (GGDEF)-like protein